MAAMMLSALGITELRDIFGAAPPLAERLRSLTAKHFASPPARPRRRGRLIGRLGPALKQPIDPPPIPERPCELDCEALLAARAVPPDRLGHAWQILEAWLAELSWGQLELPGVDQTELEKVEFDLALAGLPSRFSLERLFANDPAIPLRPLPGQRFGYAKHAQVTATRQALGQVIGEVAESSRELASAVLEYLNHFPEWAARADHDGRPAPDLIVIWPDARG